MARENRFVILLTEAERQVVETLARVEKLPASTLARRWLLFEAERRGIVPCNAEKHNRAGAEVQEDLTDAVAV